MAGRHIRDQVQINIQAGEDEGIKTLTMRKERREHLKQIREKWWAGVVGGGNNKHEYSDFLGECLCLR